MKRFITCLLVLAMLLSAASCVKRTAMNSPKEVFELADASITLSSAFETARTNDYTACYEASDVTVYIIQEKFEDLTEEQASISLATYVELVRANNISKNPTEATATEAGYTTFELTYENPITKEVTKTFCALYRTPNSFWTVQFACEEEIFEGYLETFHKWASSVSFKLKDTDYIMEKKVMITMAEGFVETNLDDFIANNRVARIKTEEIIATYESDDGSIIINLKKESKTDAGVKKIKAYSELTYERYGQQASLNTIKNLGELKKVDSLRYFEFEFNQSIPTFKGSDQYLTEKYKYFVFCVDGSKAFYTIEIACAAKDYDKNVENFIKWASTATTEFDK